MLRVFRKRDFRSIYTHCVLQLPNVSCDFPTWNTPDLIKTDSHRQGTGAVERKSVKIPGNKFAQMANRKSFMPMNTLLMGVCMYLCMHTCMSCEPNLTSPEPTVPEPNNPEPEPTAVILSGEVPDDMTEEDVKNLLECKELADAVDIQKIEFLRGLNIVFITLFDPKVAAKVAQRQTVKYKGKILHFELNSVVSIAGDKVFEIDDIFDS